MYPTLEKYIPFFRRGAGRPIESITAMKRERFWLRITGSLQLTKRILSRNYWNSEIWRCTIYYVFSVLDEKTTAQKNDQEEEF